MQERIYSAIVENVERTPFLDVIMRMNKNYGDAKDAQEKSPVYRIGGSEVAVSVNGNGAQMTIKSKSMRGIKKTRLDIEGKLNIDLLENKNGN